MFALTILEKIKDTRPKFSQGSVTALQKFFKKARVKTTNTQLYKLKSAASNKIGTTLRRTKKNLQYIQLRYEFFLRTRQKTKKTNAFNKNMSTDIKLSNPQLSKIIQSGGFLGKS